MELVAESPGLGADADWTRAALELLASKGRVYLGIARRVSLCGDDADDAYQRAVEILLTKGSVVDAARLPGWMAVVTRREALAVRRGRERLLGPAPLPGADARGEAVMEGVACERPGPMEHLEWRERVNVARLALAQLKPNERVALALQAAGYSYAEICCVCNWTYTKVNRSLAEGRARVRSLGLGP
jgi:DNA-directed RNA polymerase specialized sigma24 family protein